MNENEEFSNSAVGRRQGSDALNVRLVYPDHIDPQVWSELHRDGERPGLVPYGLHRLDSARIRVSYELAKPAGRDPRRWVGLTTPARWRPPKCHSSSTDVALAWDENMAVPMFVRHRSRAARIGSGVIWATDQRRLYLNPRYVAMRSVLRRLDFVWTLSRGQLPVLSDWLDVDDSLLHYVPFGIDVNFFPQSEGPERPLVLTLGNDRDRDIHTMYEALKVLKRAKPEVRVVVQTRSTLPPPKGVEVVRDIPARRLAAVYASASVVVLATRPNLHVSGMTAALEAMSVGRPVVLSDTPGAADYIVDGVTGRLVPPGDPKDLCGALIELLEDASLRQSLGRQAARHVRKHHTEQTMCNHLAALVLGEDASV